MYCRVRRIWVVTFCVLFIFRPCLPLIIVAFGRILAANKDKTMINCKEFALDDLRAVTAIPLAKYTPSGTAILSPTIANESFNPTIDSYAIVIASTASVGSLIPIKTSTCKAKDTEADSVAGRLHTVSVDCEVDGRDSSIWPLLLQLEQTPSHLILTSRDGTRFFVQGSEDTYLCTVERDGDKTSVSFKVQCLVGLQMIIDSTEDASSTDTLNIQ